MTLYIIPTNFIIGMVYTKHICIYLLFLRLDNRSLCVQKQPGVLTFLHQCIMCVVHFQAATLARGRTVRQSKLLFYGKLAEKALQTYERDGWGEFPTQIQVERREIRPTADRGPILLCVDTSGVHWNPQALSKISKTCCAALGL